MHIGFLIMITAYVLHVNSPLLVFLFLSSDGAAFLP